MGLTIMGAGKSMSFSKLLKKYVQIYGYEKTENRLQISREILMRWISGEQPDDYVIEWFEDKIYECY